MRYLKGRLLFGLEKLRTLKDVVFSSKYLLITNMGISLSLSAGGDLIEQSYMANGRLTELDKVRTYHMSISGLTIGFICHHWYNFLDARLPARTMKIVLTKVFLDQVLFSPVQITVFFVTLGLLERATLNEVVQEMWTKGKVLYTAEWVVWPPAQIVNFYFLPTKYRVLYDNTISLGYDIFTSHVKHDLEL